MRPLLVLASLALIVPLWRGEGSEHQSLGPQQTAPSPAPLEMGESGNRDTGGLGIPGWSCSAPDDIPDVEQTARGGRA